MTLADTTMAERHRSFVFDEEEKYSTMADEEPRAVFVDTNLDTHFTVLISPLSTVYSLKEQIAYDHERCFPDHGNITVNFISVELNESYYHLPDSMLLKTAFHGLPKAWFVSADVFISVDHLESLNHLESKHMKPSSKHHFDFNHVKPSEQHFYDSNNIQPSSMHHHDFVHVEPSTQQHYEFNHVQPSAQHHCEFMHLLPSSYPHETLDLSCNAMKKKTQITQMGKICAGNNLPQFEKTRERVQSHVPKTQGNVFGTKHLNESREGHHDNSAVRLSAVLSGVGCENVIKELQKGAKLVHQMEGPSTNIAETLSNEIVNFEPSPRPRAKSSKKKKKRGINGVNQSYAETSVQGSGILEKGTTPSDNENTIHKSKHKGNKTAVEVSPSQLNNVQELLPQHGLGKENVEDIASLKSNITGNERISPFHQKSVPELVASQHESSNMVERQKDIEEDVDALKLGKTAKRQKRNEAKNSGTENQNFSNKRPNDDSSRPEDSIGTMSGNLNISKNSKAVPQKGPPGSPESQKLDQETSETPASLSVNQSGKRKKRSHKKHSVPASDPADIPMNQHIDEITMELDDSRKVERTDEERTDDPLKRENTDKERKTNDDEHECRAVENVSVQQN